MTPHRHCPPTGHTSRRSVALTAALLLTLLAACNWDSTGPKAVARVDLSLSSDSVRIGETLQATASLRTAYDDVRKGQITFASSDTMVATVNAKGQITARGVGSAQISATGGGKTATLPLTVMPVPVAAVTLAPAPRFMLTGDTLQFSAVAADSTGAAAPGNAVTWSVEDTTIAQVTPDGRIVGRWAGQARVIAAAGGHADTAAVRVYLGAGPRVPAFAKVDSVIASVLQDEEGVISVTVILVKRWLDQESLVMARSYARESAAADHGITPQTLQASLSRTIAAGGIQKMITEYSVDLNDAFQHLGHLTAPGGGKADAAGSSVFANSGGKNTMLFIKGPGKDPQYRVLNRALRDAMPREWPEHDLFERY